MTSSEHRDYRLAELVAALSLATDLGTGQPMEHTLRTCLFAVRLGRELGLANAELAEVYYLALLRFVGCTANAHETAAFAGGDDLAFYAGVAAVFMGEMPEMLGYMVRHLGAGSPPLRRTRLVVGAVTDPGGGERAVTAHCEAARMLADRMGFGEAIQHALGHAFERWDGKGFPGHLAGEAIPLSVRITIVARDVEIMHRLGGTEMAEDALRRRRGKAYDPMVSDTFLKHGERLVAELEGESIWESVLQEEPSPQERIPEARLDGILQAFAYFADLKSPFTHGHSTEVAELSEAAAKRIGLSEGETTALRRAAFVHDVGRTAVPDGIWERPGPLTTEEWERVRLHPYFTERVLSRSSGLAPLAALAGSHHERLDGSGYHRGGAASSLSRAARVLAAADAYQAMTQERPYREALSKAAAARELRKEAAAGKLDGEAVQAVLGAAGQSATRTRPTWPAGLTDREVEVLRLLCQGNANPAMARRLSISTKTVGHHVEHIYGKIGVSTRAGAALFAMQHDLVRPD